MQMRAVYAECMEELMAKDPKVCLLDADLASCIWTKPLYEKYPERAINCGIAEQNMTAVAAGLASYGFKPYAESFTAFSARRACDQITLSVAYAGMNVKIVGTEPGLSMELNGGTHMSVEDVAVLRSIPNMVIVEPVDITQLRAAMPVINDYEGCLYLRLFRRDAPDVFGEGYKFDLFRADTLREGTDVTVFVSGLFTRDTLDVANALEAEGISCEVINVHTLKPIDRETVLASARKTGSVVTVENHNLIGGLHSAVLETLAAERIPVRGIGIPDRFGEVGHMPYLRKVMGMTNENIANAIRAAAQDR